MKTEKKYKFSITETEARILRIVNKGDIVIPKDAWEKHLYPILRTIANGIPIQMLNKPFAEKTEQALSQAKEI